MPRRRGQPGDRPEVGGDRLRDPPGRTRTRLRPGRAHRRVREARRSPIRHSRHVEHALAVPGADSRTMAPDAPSVCPGGGTTMKRVSSWPGTPNPTRCRPLFSSARSSHAHDRPRDAPQDPVGWPSRLDARRLSGPLPGRPTGPDAGGADAVLGQLGVHSVDPVEWPGRRPLDDPATGLLGQVGRELRLGRPRPAGPQPSRACSGSRMSQRRAVRPGSSAIRRWRRPLAARWRTGSRSGWAAAWLHWVSSSRSRASGSASRMRIRARPGVVRIRRLPAGPRAPGGSGRLTGLEDEVLAA